MGVFARTLEDVALIAEALTGHHEGDPDTYPRARVPFTETLAEEPPIPPVLGLVKTPHWDKATEETKQAFAEIVEALGAQVEEVELGPTTAEAWSWHKLIMEADMAASFEREWLKGRDQLSAPLRALIERGREVKVVDYQRALRGTKQVIDSLDELFMERYDALLTPASPGSAPKGLGATGDPVFNSLWSLCGMPAVSLPLLQDAQGLPIGVQLVGRRNFDARLLRTARWLAGRLSQA
jgi:Asp-tRNA(Asn)/Glu-tRNA(Gln) amidotransferase A subunit family amidase